MKTVELQGNHADSLAEVTRLRKENEELRRALRAKDDFIAIAAHELRNPMTPILGISQLALRSAKKAGTMCPPRIIPLLENLQDAVEAFVERATRLLDVSRIETGNLKLDPTTTDLSALVRSVAKRYEIIAGRVGSPLQLAIEDGVVGILDRLAVEQIVENLLSNAFKFGVGKPVLLRLKLEAGVACFEVKDHGPGMSADQTDRIFGQFEQIVTQYKGSGFGIGLWVTSRLIAAMKGRITVVSCQGDGSTFTAKLPLEQAETDRSPA